MDAFSDITCNKGVGKLEGDGAGEEKKENERREILMKAGMKPEENGKCGSNLIFALILKQCGIETEGMAEI